MKFLGWFTLALLSIASMPVAGTETSIRFALPYPLQTSVGGAATALQSALSSMSSGRASMELVQLEGVGDSDQILADVVAGVYDMAAVPSGLFASAPDSEVRLFDLPFLFANLSEVQTIQTSEVGSTILASLEQKKLVGLAYWNLGLNQLFAREPVMTVADLQGLRIRTFSSANQSGVIAALGANPTPVAMDDVYTALERGVVDATETPSNLATVFYDRGFYGIDNYYSELNIRPAFAIVVVNQGFWNKLSFRTQIDLAMSAKSIGLDVTERVIMDEKDAREELREQGVAFTYLTEEDHEEFRDAAKSIWD